MSIPNKRAVEGNVVKLLNHVRLDRGMTLASYGSRCLSQGEIHELVTTDQSACASGERIDRVGFLGFLEITRGGVVEIGDQVVHGRRVLGQILGFDEGHFPNHYNILIAVKQIMTAAEANLQVEDSIQFQIELKEDEYVSN